MPETQYGAVIFLPRVTAKSTCFKKKKKGRKCSFCCQTMLYLSLSKKTILR